MTFEAEHPGICASCGETFDRGTPIRRRSLGTPEEGWGHAVCPAPLTVGPPCSRCFQVPALNGACGCD